MDSASFSRQPALPPIPSGTKIGPHIIRNYAGETPLGSLYPVAFGTTSHYLDLFVAPAESAPLFEALVAASRRVRNQFCLRAYFAAGMDETTGYAWLRASHIDGAPAWTFDSLLDESVMPENAWDYCNYTDEESPHAATLAELLAAAHHDLSPMDRDRIICHLIEALATLHENGLHAGIISPETIALERGRHEQIPTAILLYYALEPTTPELQQADFSLAQALFRTLYSASPDRSGKGQQFLSQWEQGAFASLRDAWTCFRDQSAYAEVLHRRLREGNAAGFTQPEIRPAAKRLERPAPDKTRFSIHTESRTDSVPERRSRRLQLTQLPENAATPEERAQKALRARSRNHRHSRRRHHRSNPVTALFSRLSNTSEAAQNVITAFHIFFLILLICGIGLITFFYLDKTASRKTVRFGAQMVGEYSPVTVVSTVDETTLGKNLPADLFTADPKVLGAAAQNGNVLAAATLALQPILFYENGTNAVENTVIARSRMLLNAILPPLRVEAESSADAAFAYGYVTLLGLSSEPADPARAYKLLSDADKKNNPYAALLLGDWFAGQLPLPASGLLPQREARLRQAISAYRRALSSAPHFSPLEKSKIMNRAVSILKHNPQLADRDGAYLQMLKEFAGKGSIAAIAMLCEPGGIVPQDDSLQSRNLRILADSGGIPPAICAWAQARLAERFEKGIGCEPSAVSARLWYERAAQAGNIRALREMARFEKDGTGASDGLPNEERAAQWLKKAESAAPEPDFFQFSGIPLSLQQGQSSLQTIQNHTK